MNNKTVYFGHTMASYDTKFEKRCLEEIGKKFNGYEITNPNGNVHKQGYFSKGWSYFMDLVLEHEIGVFTPFRDKCWGAGILSEATQMLEHNRKVFVMNPTTFKISQLKDINEVETSLTIEETHKRNKKKQY